MLTDLLMAAWLTGVAGGLIFLAAPAMFAIRQPDRILRAVDALGLLALVTVLAVGALSDGQLLNWFTLALVCLALPAARWLRGYGWAFERAVRETCRHAAIRSANWLESGTVGDRLGEAVRWRADTFLARVRRAVPGFANPSGRSLVLVAIVSAAAAVTVYLRYAPVLGDVRLGSPEAYGVLLQARQAMHNQPAGLLTDVTAALVAALSLATSINPLHVVRLLGPAVGIGTVCAAAVLAYRLTMSVPAAAATLWMLGACTFALTADPPAHVGPAWILDRTLARQWTANDGTTALLFLLLAGVRLASFERGAPEPRRHALRGMAACLAVVALASPALLVLSVAAAAAALVPHVFRYVTIGAVATTIAVLAARAGPSDLAFTLPVALACLVTASCLLAARSLGRVTRASLKPAWESGAVATLVLVTLALLPRSAGALYLEHEMTAIKALEIASAFPRGRWLIVAPVEQLAQTYGRGWFEDPASFVAKNARRAGDPAFSFDMAVDEVFVFVERRPFKTFTSEAVDVPFPTLGDPSYRHYRSLAGRASLQAQLYALCEAYTRTHPGGSIYYADDEITIYRFPIAR